MSAEEKGVRGPHSRRPQPELRLVKLTVQGCFTSKAFIRRACALFFTRFCIGREVLRCQRFYRDFLSSPWCPA